MSPQLPKRQQREAKMSLPSSPSILHGAGRFLSQIPSAVWKLVLAFLHGALHLVGATKRNPPRLPPTDQSKQETSLRAAAVDPITDPAMAVTNILEAMKLSGSSYKTVCYSHGLADELPATGEALADVGNAAADEAGCDEPVDPAKEAEKEVHRAFMNEALDMVRTVAVPPSHRPSPSRCLRSSPPLPTPRCSCFFGDAAHGCAIRLPTVLVSASTARAT